RHVAAAAEHVGGARTGTLGSRPVAPPSTCRPERAAFAHAGDRVRARQALVSGPAVLAGRDDGRRDPSARSVCVDAPVDQPPDARTRTDRRGGTCSRRLPGGLRHAVGSPFIKRTSAHAPTLISPSLAAL